MSRGRHLGFKPLKDPENEVDSLQSCENKNYSAYIMDSLKQDKEKSVFCRVTLTKDKTLTRRFSEVNSGLKSSTMSWDNLHCFIKVISRILLVH